MPEALVSSSIGHVFARCLEDAPNYSKLRKEFYSSFLKREGCDVSDEAAKFGFRIMRAVFCEKDTNIEPILRLVEQLAAEVPDTQVAADLWDAVVDFLLDVINVKEALHRFRACMFLARILNKFDSRRSLESRKLKKIRDSLLGQLRDKSLKVRGVAVQALAKLYERTHEVSILKGLLELLDRESAKAVRVAVVVALPPDENTMEKLQELTLDAPHEVRTAVYKKLSAVPVSSFSVAMLSRLLQRGLRDREGAVSKEAGRMVGLWLSRDCDGDAEKLLGHLGVEEATQAAELVLEHLLASNTLDGLQYLQQQQLEAASPSALMAQHLEQPQACVLVSSEKALLWSAVCLKVSGVATARGMASATTTGAAAAVEAATASAYQDALEAFLPESSQLMCKLVQLHLEGGPASRFAACQLMRIAGSCADWTDAPSRQCAAELLLQMMSLDPESGEEAQAASPAALVACGGSSLWEDSVCSFAAQVHGSDGAELVGHMLQGVQLLAAAWKLEEVEQQGGQHVASGSNSSSSARLRQWLHWLLRLLHALARLGAVCPTPGLSSLMHKLVMPASLHTDPHVRSVAVQCLSVAALTVQLSGGFSSWVRRLGELAVHEGRPQGQASGQAQYECEPNGEVQRQATKGLMALLAAWGPARLDEALQGGGSSQAPAPHAAAAAGAAESSHGDDGGSGGGGSGATLDDLAGLLSRTHLGPEAEGVQQGAGAEAAAGLFRRGVVEGLLNRLSGLVDRLCDAEGLSDDEQGELQELVQGFASLLAHQADHVQLPAAFGIRPLTDHVASSITAQLLLLIVHPATEQLQAVRQRLAVFFQGFCSESSFNKRMVVGAVMLAVHHGLLLPLRKNTVHLDVVKLVGKLLQLQPSAGDVAQEGHHVLALQVMREVEAAITREAGSVAKPTLDLMKELVQLLTRLELSPSEPRAALSASVCASRCLARLGSRGDRALTRHLQAFSEKLEGVCGGSGAQPLSEEELCRLLQDAPELEWGGSSSQPTSGAPPRRSTRSKGGAVAPAGGRRRAAAKKRKDESEEEEESSGGSDEGEPGAGQQEEDAKPVRGVSATTATNSGTTTTTTTAGSAASRRRQPSRRAAQAAATKLRGGHAEQQASESEEESGGSDEE